jgi:SAM-dependent methyltransferase
VERIKSSGRLLDVGAGSGILVDAARQLGFAAEGIETSYPLWRAALDRGLPVRHGVLPHADVQGPFDLVTVVDVIEHVDDPLGLLGRVRELMTEDGVALIVTPDVRSVAARVMGRYWWHYRIAHIGYFDRDTLTDAARRSGLRVVEMRRPSWYLPVSYLLERLLSYLPRALQVTSWPFLSRWTVRFNLFDSLMVVCRKA